VREAGREWEGGWEGELDLKERGVFGKLLCNKADLRNASKLCAHLFQGLRQREN
jgi:hypothetical protein